MTGSLTVKNGKYYAVLNVYKDGKRKKKWICSNLAEKGNKRKAEQFLREKIAEYERMEGIVHSDVLFADYVTIWLEYIARTVDTITMQGYRTTAKCHVLPYFMDKRIKLCDVDCKVLQQYIDHKHKLGRRDGKGGLSPKSLREHKNVISQALDMAVKNKLIPSNPFQFVVLPPLKKHEAAFYNEVQLKNLFAALRGDPMHDIVKITVLFGLRRSELLGLKWDCIDFDRKTMTIRHTVCKVTETISKDKTKTASSHRTFPLMDEALKIFKEAKCLEQQNRLAFGREYHENDYIFKWPDGRPYSPDYLTHRFSDLLIKHNLPHIRFHDLRHSCASMLIAMNWSLKDVQEWLGHSDIQMTANIYSHLDTARKVGIAASLENQLKL